MTTKITCPSCDHGKLNYSVVSSRGTEKLQMNCIDCDGIGEITENKLNQINKAKEIWCRCDKLTETTYHPDCDGNKHHWTCNECGKIQQVGWARFKSN